MESIRGLLEVQNVVSAASEAKVIAKMRYRPDFFALSRPKPVFAPESFFKKQKRLPSTRIERVTCRRAIIT